ncbi:hypothetical protein [Thalassoglobus sp.]|uniref:hypothetical protein n=1 Tax=Thalassoglobus sp. TaxID=2795869 RepID=UPI003AA9A86E
MTAQFAGSRSLDDRRRRRLAQESTEEVAPQPSKQKTQVKKSPEEESKPEKVSLVSDVVADESLVPSALWKVIAFAVSGLSLLFGLVWINLKEPALNGIERLLSPAHGNAFQLFSVLSLMLASQLCFTIWWYRSRSRKDFSGRYRIWAWAGSFWALACVSTGLRLHEPLAQLAYERWPIHSWRPELLYWFVPFSVCVMALHQLLSVDMRHSRSSRVLWNFTLIIGLSVAGLNLGLDLSVSEPIRELAVAAATALWHFWIAFSLLFHARFVVHVTNEAAPRGVSRMKRAMYWFHGRTAGIRGKLGVILEKRKGKKSDKQKQKSLSKTEKFEARKKLKEEAKAAREKAQAEKLAKREQAEADRKAAKEAKQQEQLQAREEKEAAKSARLKQQQAEKEAKRAEKEAKQAEKKTEAKQPKPSKTSKQPKEPVAQKNSEPKASAEKPEPPAPEPRTASGRKRKRVLGNSTRIDRPETTKPPHVPAKPEPQDYSDEYDVDEYMDNENYDDYDSPKMSKKERRRARKNKQR